MKTKILASMVLLATCVCESQADIFNFSITYDGTVATVDGGSDPIMGTNLVPGDSFILDIHTQGTDFWSVSADTNLGIYASFFVLDSGTRTGNVTTTFFMNGVQVAQDIDAATAQTSVHFGADSFTLTSGLTFDQVVVNYDFISTTSTMSTIQNDGLNWSPFYNEATVVYSAIPEPVGASTIGLLALLGLLVRKRKR
jgi:hypothetical protein